MAIVPRNNIPGKVCKVCTQWKPLAQFKGNGRSKDGHDHKCRSCRGYRQIEHTKRNGIIGKVCKRCDAWKSLNDFPVDNQKSDGRHTYCAECNASKSREAWKQDRKTWNERSRQDYYRHRKKRLHQVKEYRQENLDQIRAYDRRRNKKRYQENPGKRAKYSHDRRAREANADGSYTAEEWRELCEQYDHTCLCCGKQEPEISLTVDHVVPLSKGGTNNIDNLQPLCLTCNLSKATKIIDYRPQGR